MVKVIVVLALLCVIAHAEVNYPNFEDLVNQHCRSQCHKHPIATHYPAVATAQNAMNTTQIDEIIRERLHEFERSVQPQSCRKVSPFFAKATNSTGGVYNIFPLGLPITEVYCDTTTDGGGWTVFQRRMDGSVDFYLGWEDYVRGFGDKRGEFWLGLENIHRMTKNGDFELRVDMIQINGTVRWAKYESFSLGPASEDYRLSVSGYSGNASDALALTHNDRRFTTKDRDNDRATSTNCAEHYSGAWWYSRCYASSLNGIYGRTDDDGVRWWWMNQPQEAMAMQFAEMKFRKKE